MKREFPPPLWGRWRREAASEGGAPRSGARGEAAHPPPSPPQGEGGSEPASRHRAFSCFVSALWRVWQNSPMGAWHCGMMQAELSVQVDDQIHILIVDDDRSLRSLIRDFLVGHGYRVSEADGAQPMRALLERERV